MKSCREPRCYPRVGPVCRETFGVTSWVPSSVLQFNTDLGLLLRRCRGQGPHLGMMGNHVVFLKVRRDSRVTTGNSGFLLCWPREVQSSIRVSRESWGLLLSHCRAKETSSRLCPGPNIPLQGRQRSRGCIPDASWESELDSRGSKGPQETHTLRNS